MPTPTEVLLDPLSLIIISMYCVIMLLEVIFPARHLPKVKNWYLRSQISFITYFLLSVYLPLIWDEYLVKYRVFDLSDSNVYFSVFVALLAFELLIYFWHRTLHKSKFLWRSFHQLHHSAERLDTFGTFYFSPLDMIGFTFIGSISLSLVVGLSPQAITLFIVITTFLVIFQHTNIKTPRWLGYFIQRPESHSVHHQKGVHAYNYSDLPIFDIMFGTFKNPKEFANESGFYHGASSNIYNMLLWKDIYQSTAPNLENGKAAD